MSPLSRIVPWSHDLVTEVLLPGDLAVDLTAGRGRDTLALAQVVGEEGQVIAFDLQLDALDQTRVLLEKHGLQTVSVTGTEPLPHASGVVLVNACHSSLKTILPRQPRAVIANLGYLPGGDPEKITRPETTQSALLQSLKLLMPGGRLAVVVYHGHPGGAEEAAVVTELFSSLPSDSWQVLHVTVANRPEAPYLLVAEKTCT